MGRIKEYIFPSDIEEAAKLACEEDVVIVSGGTGVMTRRKNLDNKTLVDITRLNIPKINDDKENIHIQPITTMSEIEENAELKVFSHGVMSKAAENVGSRQIRNQVTIGGNVISSYPWSDVPPVLLCFDAKLCFKGKQAEKTILAEEFFALNPEEKKQLGLLTDILIPRKYAEYVSDFYAFQKTVVDFSMATVASIAKVNGNKIEDIRISVSGCTVKPLRLKELEKEILMLDVIDKDNILKLCKKHCVNICNRVDFRLSSEYAEHIVAVHTSRMILKYAGKEEL